MRREIGLVALVVVAVLAIFAVVGFTRPIRVEPPSAPTPTAALPTPPDAGSLDSLLDAIQVEHLMKHGR